MDTCPICGRELILGKTIDEHHLKPKTFGSKNEVHDPDNKVMMHVICHMKIHHTFSERELLSFYHSIDRIVEHEEIQKFIKWVSKKDPEFVDTHKDTKQRRKRRKR